MSLLKTIKHEGHNETLRKTFNLLPFVYFVSFVFENFLRWSHK